MGKTYQSNTKRHIDKSQLVLGTRATIEALRSGVQLERIFMQNNLTGNIIKEMTDLARETVTPLSRVPLDKLNGITQKKHQGVVAINALITYKQIEHLIPTLFEQGQTPLVLLLDKITDMRNFGAIARTAECMGVDAIVVPTVGAAMVNEDSIRTSAGALFHLSICRALDLSECINFLKNSGLRVVACSEKASDSLPSTNMEGPLALVIGSEEKGISSNLLPLVDAQTQIPMYGKVASLNVSVATGMFLYEVQKQRKS